MARFRLLALTSCLAIVWLMAFGMSFLTDPTLAVAESAAPFQPLACDDIPHDGTAENGFGAGAGEGWREFCELIYTDQCFSSLPEGPGGLSTNGMVAIDSIHLGVTRLGSAVPTNSVVWSIRASVSTNSGEEFLPGDTLSIGTNQLASIPVYPAYETLDVSFALDELVVGLARPLYVCLRMPEFPADHFAAVDQNSGLVRNAWTTSGTNVGGNWEYIPGFSTTYDSFIIDASYMEGGVFGDGVNFGHTTNWSGTTPPR